VRIPRLTDRAGGLPRRAQRQGRDRDSRPHLEAPNPNPNPSPSPNSNPNPKPSPNPNPNPNPNSNPTLTLTLTLTLTRRASSPADAHGGGAGVWGLWPPPTTSEAAHVEPGVVRPRREKAVAAVRATTALERGRSPGVAAGSGSAPKGSASCHASCPPAEEARSRHKLAMQPEERAHEPSTLSVLAEAAGAMQER